jgi:hypothetical protein
MKSAVLLNIRFKPKAKYMPLGAEGDVTSLL